MRLTMSRYKKYTNKGDREIALAEARGFLDGVALYSTWSKDARQLYAILDTYLEEKGDGLTRQDVFNSIK